MASRRRAPAKGGWELIVEQVRASDASERLRRAYDLVLRAARPRDEDDDQRALVGRMPEDEPGSAPNGNSKSSDVPCSP